MVSVVGLVLLRVKLEVEFEEEGETIMWYFRRPPRSGVESLERLEPRACRAGLLGAKTVMEEEVVVRGPREAVSIAPRKEVRLNWGAESVRGRGGMKNVSIMCKRPLLNGIS